MKKPGSILPLPFRASDVRVRSIVRGALIVLLLVHCAIPVSKGWTPSAIFSLFSFNAPGCISFYSSIASIPFGIVKKLLAGDDVSSMPHQKGGAEQDECSNDFYTMSRPASGAPLGLSGMNAGGLMPVSASGIHDSYARGNETRAGPPVPLFLPGFLLLFIVALRKSTLPDGYKAFTILYETRLMQSRVFFLAR